MSSVDNRIVNMSFNNAAFEAGAAQTMSTLDKLEAKLGFRGASAGLQQIEAEAGKFDLSHMGAAVDQIASRFSNLGVVAVTALATITNKAIETGAQLVKSLTVGPIGEGFSDYNLKLTSIKTVMNTTGKSLKFVSGYFDQLDTYADKTIFKLSDMTGAFAKFTNAGVSIKQAVPAIKGISNMVALAGQGADAASIAYYNLSQSISGGFLTTTDYKSLNLANVATKEWKQNVIDAAVSAGTLRKDGKDMYTTLSGDSEKAFKSADLFNSGLSEQWANSKILLKVLGKYGDETTKIGKKAQGAAQDVKSLPMMLDTLKAAVGTSWTRTFEIMFGNVNQSTKLFTNLTNTIQGLLDKSNNARNKLLGDWAKLGGRAALIESIKNIFQALGDVLGPIHDAFRDIFPAKTGQQLADATKRFQKWTESLRLGEDTMDNLKHTFRGVFAVFDILGQVVKGAIGVVTDLFGTVGEGSGGFLEVTAAIGDWLVALDQAIKDGDGLTKFFEGLSTVIKAPIQLLQTFVAFIEDVFGGADVGKSSKNMADGFGEIFDAMTPLEALGKRVGAIFDGFSKAFQRVADIIKPLANFITDGIHSIGDAIANAFDGNSFNSTLDAINTGLFAGLVLLFRKFINGGLAGLLGGGKGGILGTIKGAFNGLTKTLSAMQANLRADTLMKIAIAIGLLTVSIVALSLIDSDKLTKAMAAIAVGFGELVGAMALLEKMSKGVGFAKLPFITGSLILLAGAMVLLAAAVKIFSTMNWDELARGMVGVAGTLTAVAIGMRAMPKGMVFQAAALTILAIALSELAGAVKLFSLFNYSEIGKGLVGIGGALVVIAAGMQLMPATLPITAAGLVLVGIGLAAVAGAMKLMAGFSWAEMGKGLAGVAGALVVIAGAMQLMPATLPITAAGLVLVAIALTGIAAVAKIFATMSWKEMGKAGAALAGLMIILAAGLNAMSGTLLGSAALLVAAGALTILTPVLIALGSLSWESIAKGLLALAGAFTVLGVAGLLLTPLIPSILALSGALALTGAGLALAGAGALAFATAFAIITATGAAGVAVLAAMLNVIIDAIPATLKAFGVGIVEFIKIIGSAGPEFTKAFSAILSALLDAVIKNTPKIGRAFSVLIQTALKIIRDNVPDMITAGLDLLIALLKGIRDHIGKIVSVVAQLIVKFIDALGRQLPSLLDAGARFIIDFINGLANTMRDHQQELIDAGYNLAGAIVSGMVKGLLQGPAMIAGAAADLGHAAIGFLKKAVDAHSPSKEAEKVGRWVGEGFAKGLVGSQDDVKNSMDELRSKIRDQFDQSASEIKSMNDKLDSLRKEKKPDQAAIDKLEKQLAVQVELHKRAGDAHKALTKDLADERAQLYLLGKQYDDLTDQIKEATDALKARQDEMLAFQNSTTDKFSVLPEIDKNTTLAQYVGEIQTQTADVEKFHASLDTLRNMGLSDTEYQKFLDEGVGIQPFLDKLIAAGPIAVGAVNGVADQLGTAARSLGDEAGIELKQAGVDAAQGLLDGLKSQRANIAAEMTTIAGIMVKAIKKALKSHSPSLVMEEIGKFANEGLAQGLDKYAYKVDNSAANVANTAIDSIKKTLRGMADHISTEVNTSPTITPILDLTQVTKDAADMSEMLDKAAMAQATFTQATDISDATLARLQAAQETETTTPTPTTTVELTQINNSPKALSPVEIYRQTRNLISNAEEALSNAVK